MWALASRWTKIALLYGRLGLTYWLALLFLGIPPDALLQTMPLTAGIALTILFAFWLLAMRDGKTGTASES